MLRLRVLLLSALLASCLGLSATPAHAQHGGGGHGGGMGPGGMGGGMGPGFSPGASYGRGGDYGRDNGRDLPNRAPDSAGSVSGARNHIVLAPLGRWWDDKHFAKSLKLRPDQQRRMDSIFEASRPSLARSLGDLEQEQGRLDAMYRSKSLDENTLYAQIDKVSQARAELGKVYTHYLLQIRGEMDSNQLQRLEEQTGKAQ